MKTGKEGEILVESWIGGTILNTKDGAKSGEEKGEKEKFQKREKIVILKPSEEEEFDRKEKEEGSDPTNPARK